MKPPTTKGQCTRLRIFKWPEFKRQWGYLNMLMSFQFSSPSAPHFPLYSHPCRLRIEGKQRANKTARRFKVLSDSQGRQNQYLMSPFPYVQILPTENVGKYKLSKNALLHLILTWSPLQLPVVHTSQGEDKKQNKRKG